MISIDYFYTRFNTTKTGAEKVTAIAVGYDGDKRQLTRSYNYALSPQENHLKVAQALDLKLTLESILAEADVVCHYAPEDKEAYISRQIDECGQYHLVLDEETSSGRGYRMRIASK
jgi:hypothetical protein